MTFPQKYKQTVGILFSGLVVAVVGWWLTHPGPALAQPAGQKVTPKNEDSLGYTAHFQRELQKIGQISPQEFARRYPGQAKYLDKFGWDPATAKFWDDFNIDPKLLP